MYTVPHQKVNCFRCFTSANINHGENCWTLDFLHTKFLILHYWLLFEQLVMYFFLFLIIKHGETYSKTLCLINRFRTNKTYFYNKLKKAGNFPFSPHNSLWRHIRANTVWSAALALVFSFVAICKHFGISSHTQNTRHIFFNLFTMARYSHFQMLKQIISVAS